ncbi:hypothetical protein D9M71_445620 [compost metagenome]
MEEIESSINRYLTALDTADRQEPAVAQVKAERLHDKIATLKTKLQELKEVEVCGQALIDTKSMTGSCVASCSLRLTQRPRH